MSKKHKHRRNKNIDRKNIMKNHKLEDVDPNIITNEQFVALLILKLLSEKFNQSNNRINNNFKEQRRNSYEAPLTNIEMVSEYEPVYVKEQEQEKTIMIVEDKNNLEDSTLKESNKQLKNNLENNIALTKGSDNKTIECNIGPVVNIDSNIIKIMKFPILQFPKEPCISNNKDNKIKKIKVYNSKITVHKTNIRNCSPIERMETNLSLEPLVSKIPNDLEDSTLKESNKQLENNLDNNIDLTKGSDNKIIECNIEPVVNIDSNIIKIMKFPILQFPKEPCISNNKDNKIKKIKVYNSKITVHKTNIRNCSPIERMETNLSLEPLVFKIPNDLEDSTLKESNNQLENNLDNNIDLTKGSDNKVKKIKVRNSKITVHKTTILNCSSSERMESNLSLEPLVSTIPIVLSEIEIPIFIEAFEQFAEPVYKIISLDKKVILKKSNLVVGTDKLFVNGVIEENIEYTTANYIDKDSVNGIIRKVTFDIPFKFSTRVIFTTKPRVSKNSYILNLEPYNEDSNNISTYENNYEHFKAFNNKVFCKLNSAKILEIENQEGIKQIKDTLKGTYTFKKVGKKIIVILKLTLLQNQDVFNYNRNKES